MKGKNKNINNTKHSKKKKLIIKNKKTFMATTSIFLFIIIIGLILIVTNSRKKEETVTSSSDIKQEISTEILDAIEKRLKIITTENHILLLSLDTLDFSKENDNLRDLSNSDLKNILTGYNEKIEEIKKKLLSDSKELTIDILKTELDKENWIKSTVLESNPAEDDILIIEDEEETSPEEDAKESNEQLTSQENKKLSSSTDYYIKVNYQANVVNVYKKDENGDFQPFKAMTCSTGTSTPRSGVYSVKTKWTWGALFGNVWGHYVTKIVGNILFHSVPYLSNNPATLEYWEYNKLGTAASMGCVRLAVKDSKWIFDNMPYGTPVEFYADSNPGPMGKPTTIQIDENNEECRDWDPTDPDTDNPWLNYNKKAKEEEEKAKKEAEEKAKLEEEKKKKEEEQKNIINNAKNETINATNNTIINSNTTNTNTNANTNSNTNTNSTTNTSTNTTNIVNNISPSVNTSTNSITNTNTSNNTSSQIVNNSI